MSAKRIQRKRSRGWKMPEGAIYVGRPTKWGNPCKIWGNEWPPQGCMPLIAVDRYRVWITEPEQGKLYAAASRELRGKDLACWCPLDQPCHADVLLEIANQEKVGE